MILYNFILTFYLDSGDYDFMGIIYNYSGGKIMNKTPPKNDFSMTEKERKDFIFRIGTIRQNAHMSARELSLLIEKNAGYINRIETTGDFLPSMDIFISILKACNVTAEEFFYHDPVNYKQDMELLNTFKKLTPNQRQHLIELFKDI